MQRPKIEGASSVISQRSSIIRNRLRKRVFCHLVPRKGTPAKVADLRVMGMIITGVTFVPRYGFR